MQRVDRGRSERRDRLPPNPDRSTVGRTLAGMLFECFWEEFHFSPESNRSGEVHCHSQAFHPARDPIGKTSGTCNRDRLDLRHRSWSLPALRRCWTDLPLRHLCSYLVQHGLGFLHKRDPVHDTDDTVDHNQLRLDLLGDLETQEKISEVNIPPEVQNDSTSKAAQDFLESVRSAKCMFTLFVVYVILFLPLVAVTDPTWIQICLWIEMIYCALDSFLFMILYPTVRDSIKSKLSRLFQWSWNTE